jgi:xanthosine utilization system XapX-like protein
MRYYLSLVALGLLMGGVLLLLEIHTAPPPAMAVIGLFGAHGAGTGTGTGAGGLPA